MSDNTHRRRRTHKSKSVSTAGELWLHRLLIGFFVIAAILLAAYLTMVASRL